ncbi:MAG: Asp-tRNA(Asn)/Glu-tRNA(Gln) amidotransferase subunit GatB [Candidatus Wildermuthbacteria bacterium]|nr:Asp-tRNA(Asn)/Glu-tRNA(Gln) amidotransferase subunit GatB [Candidatus Wildermuthbacteria bacterium]
MTYTPTIGLEIHAELKTKSKMFCSCKNDPLEQHPNINICPICLAHPGTLPVANKDAINKVIQVGLALGCTISEHSKFDRKNYFYPDLPKGYQISQYDAPFCLGGHLDISTIDDILTEEKSKIQNPKSKINFNNQILKRIQITRVHLEEDTGRLAHPIGAEYSLVDFNRAGVPLMELVTEPDITSAKEASAFAQELQLILRYLGASDADMEKGQMRVEANISVRPQGQEKLGTKVEVKNLNSFRAVEGAIEYEIQRQTEALESGKSIVQETRGWNDAKGTTYSQREKESAHDYRYFPEPDLPPFQFSKKDIESIRAQLPELPQQRRKRLVEEYGLSEKETEVFVRNKDMGEYFEKVVSELGPRLSQERLKKLTKLSANYILSDLMGLLEGASVEGEDFLITPENFAELVLLIEKGEISSAIAKQVLKEMFAKGKDPSQIIEEKGLSQVTSQGEIETIAKEVIAKNPKAVEDFKKGKENALQFLVGQTMASSKGTVNPDTAKKILQDLLHS